MVQAAGESNFSAESLKRSWWFLFTLVPFGLLAFAAFLFIWKRTGRREWRNSAIVYGLVFWVSFIIAAIEDLPDPLRQTGALVFFFGMFVPPIHALVIRPRYLAMVRSGHTLPEQAPPTQPQVQAPSGVPAGAIATSPVPVGGALVPTTEASAQQPPPQPQPQPALVPAVRELEVPGWATRWVKGRVRYGLGWVVVVVMILVGIGAMTESSDRFLGFATISFGLAVVLTLPQLRTWRRRGSPVISSVESRGGAPSLHFGYSRTGPLPYAGALSALAILLLLADPGELFSHPVVRALGVSLVAVMVLVGARTLKGRKHWFLGLTREGIAAFHSGRSSFIPWDSIRDVIAFDYSPVGRPVGFSQPHIGLFVERTGEVQLRERRFLSRLNRPLMGDISFSLDLLDSDPALLFVSIRYYWKNPDARSELGTPAALDRAAIRDFDDPALS